MSSNRRRHILIIVENLPVPFDRRVWQEARTLVGAGYRVSVICPKGKGYDAPFEVLDHVEIYRHPLPLEADGALGYALEYGAALFWELALALHVWRKRGVDAVHACNPPDTIFLIGALFRLFGKKFVFDHHDINPELYEAKFGKRGFFHKLMLFLERMSFRTAHISIATNESYKEIAITRGGMPEDRVFVVRSGPDLSRIRIAPPNPELKRGRAFLVGYVGVIGKQEGVDYLLRAAQYIIRERARTDVHFGIVGGGTELEALKQYADELGIGDFVTFTGRAPDEELLEMLNTADVCVNPDVANAMNDKSTMNKIMEYMALEKPIVQFDLTEGRVSAGEASLYAAHNDYVDLAEKILELLDDPERRRRMGEFGRARVLSELSWAHQAPKLLAAYDRLWGQRNP